MEELQTHQNSGNQQTASPPRRGAGRSVPSMVLLFVLTLTPVLYGWEASAEGMNLRMKYFTIVDPQMGGIPAFRIMAPADWEPRGGLNWDITLANLVTADLSITAPDGSAGLFVHPAPQFISGMIEGQWPRGGRYLGMIVMPIPDSPVDFLQKIVLPQRRAGVRDLRLMEQEPLDTWAAQVAEASRQPGAFTQGFGTRARFTYEERGQRWEEDFYCAVVVSRPEMGPHTLFWLADRNLSVRAAPGKLNALKSVANAFVNSVRIEKRWYAHYLQVQEQWIAAQRQGIANAGALSRAISRSSDQISASMRESWQQRQQAEDRASREFSEYIRGSEHYEDTVNHTQVELPSGYDQVWTNSLGEYMLSDTPGFNPNLGSNLNWQRIDPSR